MNRRQRKKQFKWRYGFNPPKSISISDAEKLAKTAGAIKQIWERIKEIMQGVAEQIEKAFAAVDEKTLETLMRKAKLEDATQQQLEEIEKEKEEEQRWQQYTKL